MELKKSIIHEDLNPLEFYLSQNYPNPAQKRTTIKYCIPYKSVVQFRVFNEDGDEIDLLLNEEKKPGTYELTIITENYKNGIYLYLLSTDTFSKIKKMQVSKNNN